MTVSTSHCRSARLGQPASDCAFVTPGQRGWHGLLDFQLANPAVPVLSGGCPCPSVFSFFLFLLFVLFHLFLLLLSTPVVAVTVAEYGPGPGTVRWVLHPDVRAITHPGGRVSGDSATGGVFVYVSVPVPLLVCVCV